MTYMAILNKRFAGASLKDALIPFLRAQLIRRYEENLTIVTFECTNCSMNLSNCLLFDKFASGTAQLDHYFNDASQFSKSIFKDFSEGESVRNCFKIILTSKMNWSIPPLHNSGSVTLKWWSCF
jgi:hypothetical protein